MEAILEARKKTCQLPRCRVSPELEDLIRTYAQEQGVTVSAAMRMALFSFFDGVYGKPEADDDEPENGS